MAERSVHRLRPLAFVVGTAVVVALIGLLAAIVTWRFHPEPPPPCIANCPPPTPTGQAQSTPLAEAHTYRNPGYGFEVDYPSGWSASSNGSGALFETRWALLWINGDTGGRSSAQLVIDSINGLDPNKLPDIRAVRPIRGARVGLVAGAGQTFAATLVPGSGGGQALVVRIPIEAAVTAGLGLVARGIVPYDLHSPGGVYGGDTLDYLLTEFRWPSP